MENTLEVPISRDGKIHIDCSDEGTLTLHHIVLLLSELYEDLRFDEVAISAVLVNGKAALEIHCDDSHRHVPDDEAFFVSLSE